MNGYLLDTNVISELVSKRPSSRVLHWIDSVDEEMTFLSVLTLGEIRKGIAALRPGARHRSLEAWLKKDLRTRFEGRVLPIDEQIADRWGRIAASGAMRGRPVPVINGLINATAIEHDLTLVTRNHDHVAPTGAAVINPWTLDERV